MLREKHRPVQHRLSRHILDRANHARRKVVSPVPLVGIDFEVGVFLCLRGFELDVMCTST